MCWMIKQEAPEYKKTKEQLHANSELAATKGKGHGLGPPGIAAFTGLLQALSERGSTEGAANAAGVANLKQNVVVPKTLEKMLSGVQFFNQ